VFKAPQIECVQRTVYTDRHKDVQDVHRVGQPHGVMPLFERWKGEMEGELFHDVR
jgi:hypothetical protein